MRKFFLFLALTILGVGLNAQNLGDNIIIDYDGYSLQFTVTKVSPPECEVICSTKPTVSTELIIPSSVEIGGVECSVTGIGYEAFKDCDELESIKLPETLESIGDYAFWSCSALKSVTIPNGITSIGEWTFTGCALESVTLPESLVSIGSYAFSYCSGLEIMTLPESLLSIGAYVFEDCTSLVSLVCNAVNVPETSSAFGNVPSTMNIFVPSESVEKYKNAEPWSNYNIKSTGTPDIGESIEIAYDGYSLKFTVTDINPAQCMVTCSSQPTTYTEIIIPSSVEIDGVECSVTRIGTRAFSYCNALSGITIPDGVTSIGSYAFRQCDALSSITIPDGVTSIGEFAFYGCDALSSVTLPESLESIGIHAFFSCDVLEIITLPEGLESIGDRAFLGCASLVSLICNAVDVPTTVVNVFENVPSTMNIFVPSESVEKYKNTAPWSNYNIKSISTGTPVIGESVEIAYGGYSLKYTVTDVNPTQCMVTCSSQPTASLEIIIPSSVEIDGVECSVTRIGARAFYDCDELESVTIPDGVTSIGSHAFAYCNALSGITIPDDVTSIGSYAFAFCGALSSITIPEGVTSIGEWTFAISALESVIIPNSVTNIGRYAFYSCNALDIITLPESLVNIGDNAFYSCTSLVSLVCNAVDVPETSATAFNNIPNTMNIFVPSQSVEKYKNAEPWSNYNISALPKVGASVEIAYDGYSLKYTLTNENPLQCEVICTVKPTTLTEIIIPSSVEIEGVECSVTSVGYEAFKDCDAISSITIPDGVTSVEYSAFEDCDVLSSVILPEGLQSVEYSAFDDCDALESITIPNSVTSIGSYAFYSCDVLSSVILPEGLQSVGYETFAFCYALKSVTFPEGLVSIESRAFNCCDALLSISLPESLESIGWSAFGSCEALSSITLPEGLISVGEEAFRDCPSLSNITIPNGVISIGEEAFRSCTSLSSVSLPASLVNIEGRAFAVYSYQTSKLQKIKCYAEEVPVAAATAFDYVPSTMVIEVPEGSVSLYQASTPWNNYEIRAGFYSDISASVNNSLYGVVSGMGEYADGSTATLTATPKEGCTFVNWTENGEVVSEDREYSFVVTEDRELVANFYNTVNHWIPNVNQYPNSMTVIAVVQIDGEEQRTPNLEVGAFCNGELRGSQRLVYEEVIDRYYLYLMIYGNGGDAIDFRIYDHETSSELELTHFGEMIFEVNGTVGGIKQPYVFNFLSSVDVTAICTPEGAAVISGTGSYKIGETATVEATANEGYLFDRWTMDGTTVSTEASYSFTVNAATDLVAHFYYYQTRELSEGWNWYSTYIDVAGAEGLDMMKESLGENVLQIKGQTAFCSYEDGVWLGPLNLVSQDQMYMIQMSEAGSLEMYGDITDPSSLPITLPADWSWISYPVNQYINISTALSNISPNEGDYIKSQNGFSQYDELLGWRGSLNTLSPGQGYMYQNTSGESKTLVYAVSNTKEELLENVTSERNHWVPDAYKYPTNMSVIAVVKDADIEMSGYEIGVFAGSECRGSARPIYIEELDSHIVFLTVYGEEGEELSLKYYDIVNDEEVEISSRIRYSVNGTTGNIKSPYEINISESTIAENISVYPNPVKDMMYISSEEHVKEIRIYNVVGATVYEGSNLKGNSIDISVLESGVYFVEIRTENTVINKQIIKQ